MKYIYTKFQFLDFSKTAWLLICQRINGLLEMESFNTVNISTLLKLVCKSNLNQISKYIFKNKQNDLKYVYKNKCSVIIVIARYF